MNATKIIREKEVRDFLLCHFPKPKHTVAARFSIPNKNANSSLTGNAIELLLNIKRLKSKKSLFKELECERVNAKSNLKWLLRHEGNLLPYKKNVILCLNEMSYKRKLKEVKELAPNKCTVEKHTYPFCYSSITVISGNDFFELKHKICSTLAIENSFYQILYKSLVVINLNSLIQYLDNSIHAIISEGQKSVGRKTIPKSFITCLLVFTQVSSQYFRMIDLIDGFCFSNEYIKYVSKIAKNIALNDKRLFAKRTLSKPSLKSYGIFATPDFITGDKILEMKTSQKFFSTDDYLQILLYLILSKTTANIKAYGIIKSAILFNPKSGEAVEIDASHLDKKSKIAHLFLKNYMKRQTSPST
jgi:hypothetical protein